MKDEMTYYEVWQKEKYGDILPPINRTPDEDLFESGIDELNRLSEFIESKTDQLLIDEEK